MSSKVRTNAEDHKATTHPEVEQDTIVIHRHHLLSKKLIDDSKKGGIESRFFWCH